MDDLTFEDGDANALPFIDIKETIKFLENMGYRVIDMSEPGDIMKTVNELKSIAESQSECY